MGFKAKEVTGEGLTKVFVDFVIVMFDKFLGIIDSTFFKILIPTLTYD